MGDIADMMLDGTLDEETGEYLGDHNLAKYGTESPGFPVSLQRESRKRKGNRVPCPRCGKHVKPAGLDMHIKAKHPPPDYAAFRIEVFKIIDAALEVSEMHLADVHMEMEDSIDALHVKLFGGV